jgi:hypothetical protein
MEACDDILIFCGCHGMTQRLEQAIYLCGSTSFCSCRNLSTYFCTYLSIYLLRFGVGLHGTHKTIKDFGCVTSISKPVLSWAYANGCVVVVQIADVQSHSSPTEFKRWQYSHDGLL